MKEIKGIKLTEKLRTHIEENLNKKNKDIEGKNIGPKEVSIADGYYVPTYRDLVEQIANLSYINKDYLLFFRGQKSDHKMPNSERSSFYPSIYRGYLREDDLLDKFKTLDIASEKLKKLLEENKVENVNELKRKKYICWSILQHYEVTDTPLIDITQSLKVACSFAQLKKTKDEVFVYVFGLPYYINRISHNSEQDLINIRLLSICHPKALRPYFQEGFSVCTEDITYKYETKDELDLNNRLIAKFKIPNNSTFWGDKFNKIPEDALYPTDDNMKKICDIIKSKINLKILAIPLKENTEHYSAKGLISMYMDKIKNDKYVYFSTSSRIDMFRAKEQNYLLLYNKEISCLFKIKEYIGDVEKKSIPKKSDKYSLEKFSNKEEKHWFLLCEPDNENLEEKLEHFNFVNKDVKQKNVYEYIKYSKRIQNFYLEGWMD